MDSGQYVFPLAPSPPHPLTPPTSPLPYPTLTSSVASCLHLLTLSLSYMTRGPAPTGRHAHIALFGAYDPSLPSGAKPQSIADPYYGGKSGFEKSYEQCVRYANGFLDDLDRKYPSN